MTTAPISVKNVDVNWKPAAAGSISIFSKVEETTYGSERPASIRLQLSATVPTNIVVVAETYNSSDVINVVYRSARIMVGPTVTTLVCRCPRSVDYVQTARWTLISEGAMAVSGYATFTLRGGLTS